MTEHLPQLDPVALGCLVGVGILAGIINVLAGGGSLLAMPVAIFVGLPEGMANGTVRLAILAQNLTALTRYHRAQALNLEGIAPIVGFTVAGATLGALVGSQLSDSGTRNALGIALLAAVVLVVARPHERQRAGTPTVPPMAAGLVMAAIGVYGGAIQAGVGYLFLFALTYLYGMDLVRANTLKIVLVTAYTPLVLFAFWGESRVHLVAGLALAIGQALGAWIGASLALSKGATIIRLALLVAVTLSAAKLLIPTLD